MTTKKPRRPSRFRLPERIRPAEYDLHLAPDLGGGTFEGRVRIAVDLDRPESAIRLHAVELRVDSAAAFRDGAEIPARVAVQPEDETLEVRFSKKLPAGRSTLALRYRGRLGQHLRGLYAARSGERRYAFTQLEAADARRMMPCFDEPSFKARFRVSITAATADTVISNAPVEREETAGADRRTVHFAETPPLSTYLLALAVGPLEASRAENVGATPVRVWHVPGKGDLTEFGLEAAVAALRRLEDYFGIPYPYGKLDLVAVPDFEAGAMENAGAVFFRETLLLLDPATASLVERKRTAEVIAHELAHMWYGDLVTMAWWDDLWLNEAFATWMAYKVVDDWRPEWRM
ncbi:MAG: M1 family metallopeptidase, partial [Candidatus Binatia bacterium]